MSLFLVFDTEAAANAAIAQINTNYGFNHIGFNAKTGIPDPTACQTTSWAEPMLRLDGKYVFAKPASDKMTGVTGHTEETHSHTWFPQEEF